MESTLLQLLAWLMALMSGLMAGTYLAFSGFIMRSFARLEPHQGIAAMNAINDTITKTSFMPLFFGSTVVALLLAGNGLLQWGEPDSGWSLVAGLVYVIGMFVVTVTANVPLNKQLAKVAGRGEEARHVWMHYLTRWTRWNTARTVASLVTLAICIELLRA